MPLAEFGTGQVFLSMLYFFLFFIWIWLLIVVFGDIFRSHDLGGFAKALWVIFVIIVPYLGVFVYLIARGHKMSEHAVAGRASPGRGAARVHPERGRRVHRAPPTSSLDSPTSRPRASSPTPSSSSSRRKRSRDRTCNARMAHPTKRSMNDRCIARRARSG